MKKYVSYRLYNFLFWIIIPFFSNAQQVQVSLNKNQILIGEQISYGLKVSLPPGMKAAFRIPDSIPHFDIIEKKEVIAVKGENAVEQVITFTSFDSGQWAFPSIPVVVSNGTRSKVLSADSVIINVGYAPDDGTGKLRDIKPVREVHINDYFWYYFLGVMILVFLLIFILVNYFSKRKKKPVNTYTHSALQEALLALDEMEKENVTHIISTRKFHSSLSQIFKRYYGRKRNADFFHATTSDVLLDVQKNNPDFLSTIASLLRENDAVSFAKHMPEEKESKKLLSVTRQLLQNIDQQH